MPLQFQLLSQSRLKDATTFSLTCYCKMLMLYVKRGPRVINHRRKMPNVQRNNKNTMGHGAKSWKDVKLYTNDLTWFCKHAHVPSSSLWLLVAAVATLFFGGAQYFLVADKNSNTTIFARGDFCFWHHNVSWGSERVSSVSLQIIVISCIFYQPHEYGLWRKILSKY